MKYIEQYYCSIPCSTAKRKRTCAGQPIMMERMINMTKERMDRMTKLIVMLAIPLGAGVVSSLLTMDAMQIFSEFNKPVFAPPGWIFPLVWTVLYLMMGYACYRVVMSKADDRTKTGGLIFYFAQLVMNFFWSLIFFEAQAFLLAFFWIIGMGALTVICTVFFMKADRAAGMLMIPYIGWTVFAGVLTMAVYVMSITPMPL